MTSLQCKVTMSETRAAIRGQITHRQAALAHITVV